VRLARGFLCPARQCNATEYPAPKAPPAVSKVAFVKAPEHSLIKVFSSFFGSLVLVYDSATLVKGSVRFIPTTFTLRNTTFTRASSQLI
jgi:hypothetical protein